MDLTEIFQNVRPKGNPPLPIELFEGAAQFELASVLLAKHAQKVVESDGSHFQSQQQAIFVNAAFALELYLKCIFFNEKGYLPEKTHDLKKLFGLIVAASRNRVRELFDEEILKCSGLNLIWIATHDSSTGKPLLTIELVLDHGSEAFEEFRYQFEGVKAKTIWVAGPAVMACRRFLLELHPEWIKRIDPFFGV